MMIMNRFVKSFYELRLRMVEGKINYIQKEEEEIVGEGSPEYIVEISERLITLDAKKKGLLTKIDGEENE